MEQTDPWKSFHRHAMIMEKPLCSLDYVNISMTFMHHGKPAMALIAGFSIKSQNNN